MAIRKVLLCLLCISFFWTLAWSQEKVSTTVSLNRVKLEFSLDKNGIPAYQVFFGDKQVILLSRLGFKLKDAIALDTNFQILKTDLPCR